MPEDRKDKFTWGRNDIKVTVSQCHDCKNNDGGRECKAYGFKPDQFSLNDSKCPEYEKE